jgi:hypothetical protein
MIVLPLTPDPEPLPAAQPRKAQEQIVVKVLVLGFSSAEQKLLEGVVSLSKRRSPCVELLGPGEVDSAHVIMIDAADKQALAWASMQTALVEKTVIWVDARSTPPEGHIATRRPVQWPLLPTLLMQAVDHGLEHRLASVRGALNSRPMSVF